LVQLLWDLNATEPSKLNIYRPTYFHHPKSYSLVAKTLLCETFSTAVSPTLMAGDAVRLR